MLQSTRQTRCTYRSIVTLNNLTARIITSSAGLVASGNSLIPTEDFWHRVRLFARNETELFPFNPSRLGLGANQIEISQRPKFARRFA